MSTPILESRPDFSLVLGGPLFQIFLRTHLSGNALELLHRRMIVVTGIAWLPLLVLSALRGDALGDDVSIAFADDIETHVRFLIALPLLIAAELVVHRRIHHVVSQFVERGLILSEQMPEFRAAIDSTLRLRNSPIIELALIVLVYAVGHWIWRNEIALHTTSWYASQDGAQIQLTPAGYWHAFVSVPIFQFMLMRWYFRFVLWFWFLWRVSRLQLRLLASHADRAAGLGFLSESLYAFSLVLLAQGAVAAGLIASQILYGGRNLLDFKVEILSFLFFFLLVTLIPLTVFTPQLLRAKRKALRHFGRLVNRYSDEFNQKWVEGGAPQGEPLLGSGDIQSLADLGNSYSVVRETRLLPFDIKDVMRLAAISATPFLPLLLTMFSLDDFATFLLGAIF
ncbi:hypothetical protein [Peristeroidobacter agariperforans]|uniref:hypothetical protein n=1 Tax=Peristeroidobacter agariperforans TaxID=268404 RepID=UPI00101C3939|nr:hypothetical protein [Peristeroidobacter agariperforans]